MTRADIGTKFPDMSTNITPAGKEKQDLTPLPIRVSKPDYARLQRLRQIDDLTIQEHVRRAVALYLDHAEEGIRISAATDPLLKVVSERMVEQGVPKEAIVPNFIAAGARRAVRSPAPRVVSK